MVEVSQSAPAPTEQSGEYRKKLIEVALPLQAINKASAREKSISHGHPGALHPWWARRPLAACRAVLFASLVDDPSSDLERFPTPEDQERERKRLFDLIEQLVQWDNSLNEYVLAQARDEIRKSVGEPLPTVYDPFCGGGAIPIEAQRLGLPALASDLNPVAVLITKALTEIPWRFKGCAPVHPSLRGPLHERTWERATGLAADVDAYGKWMLEEATARIGNFYPKIPLHNGSQATVVAWLWARTVRCPNPLCGAQAPLIKSFALSNRSGREWSLQPLVDRQRKTVRYATQEREPGRDGTVTRRGAVCIVCNEPMTLTYIRSEGKAKRLGEQMIAIVADGPNGRVYLPPNEDHIRIALSAEPPWAPDTDLPERALGFRVQAYGMTKHRELFTSRQLLALTTFSDLVRKCRDRVLADALAAGLKDDGVGLEGGGSAALAYADAIATFLALAVDKLSNHNATLCSWDPGSQKISHVFTRQTLSMVWDYAEANPLGPSSGKFLGAVEGVQEAVAAAVPCAPVQVFARDAAGEWNAAPVLSCTDPPYYDNVPYADLSDFFYTWLRRSVGTLYPELLASILVPKVAELVADPARFADDSRRARQFFEEGLGRAFRIMRESTIPGFPTTIFYAFKQSDSTDALDEGPAAARASVGWEAMLNALLRAEFEVVGTWPMSSERSTRTRGQNSNALASSILLACRPRLSVTARSTRSDFLRALRAELPEAVRRLRNASLAATDLEQAAIGPGMAVFSRYREVLEPNGNPMSVRSALALINQELAQIVLGEIAEVDGETHFALAWFDGHFYEEAKYGEADILLKAKNASPTRLKDAGTIKAERGIFQLVDPRDSRMASAYIDGALKNMPAWSQLMLVMRALTSEDGGVDHAADMLRTIDSNDRERLKDLAYHCYLTCDRAKPKRTAEAQDFNVLVATWPDLEKRVAEIPENRLL